MAKKAFALRLDEAMLTALQRWADDEFRSVNGQIEYLLHEALLQSGRLKKNLSASLGSDVQRPEDPLSGTPQRKT